MDKYYGRRNRRTDDVHKVPAPPRRRRPAPSRAAAPQRTQTVSKARKPSDEAQQPKFSEGESVQVLNIFV
jgi:hypothetical protein